MRAIYSSFLKHHTRQIIFAAQDKGRLIAFTVDECMLFSNLGHRGLFPINLDDELLYTRPKDEVASFVAERIAALSEQEQGKLTVLYVPELIFDKAAQAQNEDQLVQELASTLFHTVQIDTESITLLVATGSSLVEK